MDAASAAHRGRFPQLAKYELIEELGHGGMATVYRARDRRLGREVAVKVIHPHLRDSREVVLRFNTEARAVAKLHHPNIVEVFDLSDPDEPEQYLVVELLRGTTLRKLLQAHKAMPPEVAAAVAIELLGALAHAHANGVVHRDVKPENVLIDTAPASASPREGVIVKLTDFGIAKLLDAQGVTSTGQVLGSPAHMAPEQIEGGEVDARADVFGLGVLLYECMVGHLPFEGSNPAQVLRRVLEGRYPEAQRERPLVGNRWSALLDRALAHHPADRFADANAMLQDIRAELERLGICDAARELEAWLDASQVYEEGHAKRMIEKLCVLGNDARRRGDVLVGAADYNRALAHAPDDPQLLRIVAAMNRAEARSRLARRVGLALLLMVGLGAVAFTVGRVVRTHVTTVASSAPSRSPAASVPPALEVSSFPAASEGATPSATVPRRVASSAAPPRESPPKVTERTITLHLEPTMGLKLSVDDEAQRDVSTGDALHLDTKAHELVFACEVCSAPVHKLLGAGDRDDTLSVLVPVKAATLDIRGDQDNTYQIVEDPQLVIRPGSNSVPLKSMFQWVTVRQMETDKRVKVRLKAGQTVAALF
jgi:tRNA A-37 threonylcarbamoyl transferase component Bud32